MRNVYDKAKTSVINVETLRQISHFSTLDLRRGERSIFFLSRRHPRRSPSLGVRIVAWLTACTSEEERSLQTERTTGRRAGRVVQQPCTDRSLISQIDTLTLGLCYEPKGFHRRLLYAADVPGYLVVPCCKARPRVGPPPVPCRPAPRIRVGPAVLSQGGCASLATCCWPTDLTVIRLTSYHRYIHRPHGIPIAHARNVNVGTGIGRPGTVECGASSGEKGRGGDEVVVCLSAIRLLDARRPWSLHFNPRTIYFWFSDGDEKLRCVIDV